MAHPNPKERRYDRRFSIAGQLPIAIFSADGDPIAFHPVDASKSGFGIVVGAELQRGTQLYLDIIDHKKIAFCVIWTVPEATNDDEQDLPLFRCGIVITQTGIDLVELLSKHPHLLLTPKE